MDKFKVKVFVTATRKFRAKIKEGPGIPAYEVTVGGESWAQGKGRQFEGQIKAKCALIIEVLSRELNNL